MDVNHLMTLTSTKHFIVAAMQTVTFGRSRETFLEKVQFVALAQLWPVQEKYLTSLRNVGFD
jgi:hypothetical protein